MIAYRIASGRHAVFDGAGAAEYGGRWNSAGRPVIYASATLSLAMLEQLAHSETGRLPRSQVFIEIMIPLNVTIVFRDHDDVDRNSKRTNQVAEPDHLRQRIGNPTLDDEQVHIRVVSRVSSGVGAEKDDGDRIGGLHEDLHGLKDRIFRNHHATNLLRTNPCRNRCIAITHRPINPVHPDFEQGRRETS